MSKESLDRIDERIEEAIRDMLSQLRINYYSGPKADSLVENVAKLRASLNSPIIFDKSKEE